jgi:hypothetical protein
MSFSTREESSNFIKASGERALVSAGPHLISLKSCPRPYLSDNPKEYAKNLLRLSQQRAWAEHSAWVSLDYLQGGVKPELEYGVLARLAAEMIDDKCCGIYVPRESSFAPNDGSLYGFLKQIAASGDTGIR